MALTCEDLNVTLNAKLQESLSVVVSGIKQYVDGKDEVLKTELTEQIVKELTEIDGLGAKLEQIQEMADTFSKVFDENEDGTITPEEILAKAVLLQQAIDGVNARLDNTNTTLEAYKKALDEEIEDLKSRVSALEVSTAQNRDEIATVKADLSTNYISRECAEKMIDIKVDGVKSLVTSILYPDTEEEGDGAVE